MAGSRSLLNWRLVRLPLLIGAFCLGFWVRGRYVAPEPVAPMVVMASAGEPSKQEVDTELNVLRRQVADQRGLLRPKALVQPQTVDEMLALQPTKFPAGDWTAAELGVFEDCWFETTDGIRLHGWYHAAPRAERAVVFLHGNAGHVAIWSQHAVKFAWATRSAVLLFDYRGYGRSEGRPTFDGMIRDGQAARDYLALRLKRPSSDIILVGQSMGGGIAVQIAAADGAKALILDRTFSSFREVAKSHFHSALVNALVADRLQSAKALSRFHGPVLITHGESDEVIPFAQGQALFAAANEPKRFVSLGPIGHNDPQPPTYWVALKAFLDEHVPIASETDSMKGPR